MKCRRVEILAAAVVLFVSASPVMAVIDFNDGGVWDIDYEINDDVWVDFESPGMGTTINILDGATIPPREGYRVKGWEDSIINILGGLMGNLDAYDNSQFAVSGGTIWGSLDAYNSSQVTVSGGSMGDLGAHHSSQVAVSGGTMTGLEAHQSSQVAVSGGSIGNLDAYDSSQFNFSEGLIYFFLRARDSSQVAVSGGSMGGLGALQSSQVAVSGGSINRDLIIFGSSQVAVSGGLIGEDLLILTNAVLTILGSDFAVDGTPVGYTELYSIFGGSYKDEPYRQLTGTLLNGDPLNNDFRIGNSAKIILVPEPASAVMLGLGSLFLALRRRRHR